MSISDFIEEQFRHFNARELRDAARGYRELIAQEGKMLVAMAGAMSTGELGISLAKMIRQGKVHAVSCTAANLEEDVFNLLAHNDYKMAANYRDLSPADENELLEQGFNRVTDTCIPESCMRYTEKYFMRYCAEAAEVGESYFPFEYLCRVLDEPEVQANFQIDPAHSWVLAAKEMGIPVFSPGFEDCTLGNIFCARVIEKKIKSHQAIRSGTEQMEQLVHWYCEHSENSPIGFFQIGGGIAGDFAICAVPLIIQDLKRDVSLWSYFAQISDSTTSYGSYSGAVPNEKITWCKLSEASPKFLIESDASIVAPLIFAYVLEE